MFPCTTLYLTEPTKPSIITPENPRTIEAQDRRPITLTIGDNVTALTNTSITIQCPTSGVPTPTVRWTVNGKEIRSDSGFSVQDDGSLLIHESQQDGNGRYICTSGNSVGNTSASSIVQIVGKTFTFVKLGSYVPQAFPIKHLCYHFEFIIAKPRCIILFGDVPGHREGRVKKLE